MAKDIKLHISGIDKETGGRFIKFPENINDLISMNNLLDIYGEIPLPPYIKSAEEESFHENSYQTEYASNPGAVAAPTAGLHLSKSLISNLKKKVTNKTRTATGLSLKNTNEEILYLKRKFKFLESCRHLCN